MTGHAVGDQRHGNSILELPGGEARTLEERARLISEDCDPLALLNCGPDDARQFITPVAGAPALQCVSTVAPSLRSSAPCAPILRLIAISSSSM